MTVASFCQHKLLPLCCRYSVLQQRNFVKLYLGYACKLCVLMLSYASQNTRSANNLGITYFTFPHFISLFVHVKHTANMAAWFCVQFNEKMHLIYVRKSLAA